MVTLGVKQANMEDVANMMGEPEITQAPDANKSYFRLAKMADGSTCADVIDQAGTLFADGPFAL